MIAVEYVMCCADSFGIIIFFEEESMIQGCVP